MPWNGTTGFPFNRQSVTASAPEASGVYALFNNGIWVYIGEAQNIKDRLLQHLTKSHSLLIERANPQWFAWELVFGVYRIARQNQLILELKPSSNQRLG